MAIQALANEVIAQIAAGEVVERPASVVKELVENALDAGATSIQIAVHGGGRRLLRVSDNGSGIRADEVELAFQRHTTSKLRTVDDLYRIETLGFRGEALASIAAVSHISLTTRHPDEAAGTTLRIEGGQVMRRQSVGAPAGTVLTVENLFYNTPARLKFLKAENTEKRQIASVITRYAMAYPQVRFVLEQDGREIFRTHGSGELADVLVVTLGLDHFRNMVEVASDEPARGARPPISVYGYTSTPELHRTDRSRITLFVNGRWVQDTSLSYAVTQAYHTFLMTGRYPIAVLMVELPPEEVDVNVHPTKAEVRFRDPNAVFTGVQRAVRQAVIELAQTPSVHGGRYTGYAGAGSANWADGYKGSAQLDLDLALEGAGQPARRGAGDNNTAEDDPTAVPTGPGAPAKPRTLPVLRVVGQVGATYIVAEGPAGLYLVDQHAAHERILYEQFMENHQRKEAVVQYTLTAQTIELAPVEARLLEEHFDLLGTLGFQLESFGTNTFVIRSVPALLADCNPQEVVAGILTDLEHGHEPGQATIEEKIITQVCKQAAVKAGQVLSMTEMQALLRQLERCNSPHTCPHGRPTLIHMSSDQLAREFGRT